MQQVNSVWPEFPEKAVDRHHTVEGEVVRPGLFAHTPPIKEPGSPSGKFFAGTRKGKLYVRAASSKLQQAIADPEEGWHWDIAGAKWSPDGKYIAVKQIDDRKVPKIPIVDWTNGQEQLRMINYSRAGEPVEKHQVYIVEVANGKTVKINHGLEDPYIHIQSWSPDGEKLRIFRTDRLMKEMELLFADTKSGSVQTIVTESSETYILGISLMQGYESSLDHLDIITFLDDRKQFIWASERSGFNQLYLYDFNGKLIRPLTENNLSGHVLNNVLVNEKKAWVYFTASADMENPYHQQLYRIKLDGSSLQKITEAPQLPEVRFSSSKDTLWVLKAGLPDLMQIDEYSAKGEFQKTVWNRDLQFLDEAGFDPEYAKVPAADGTAQLEALILKPSDFNPRASYPVIEYIYGGPHTILVPRQIYSPPLWSAYLIANQGFIVVMLDGRGTPGRGKKFQDHSYGRFGQVEIADHAAALRHLFKERQYMDSTRLGIWGHSWGGYFALRAAILEPTLYKAVQISAPAVDPLGMRVAVEPYMGCLPKDCPEAYKKGANTAIIKDLNQPLLIVHGTADDDVPLAEAMKLNKALVESGNRNYELMLLPNVDHIVMRHPAWAPATLGFFVKHLKDNEKQ